MSYSSSVPAATVDRQPLQRALVPTAIATLVPVIALTVYGAHDSREIMIVVSLAVVVTAAVFGFVLPRALRRDAAPGTALALSIAGALLVVPAFWSGLPLILGVAGALLGFAGREAVRGRVGSIAAMVIGALAGAAYLAVYASEALGI